MMRDFFNADCMDGMKEYHDKFFDLAIVDPPYGIGLMNMNIIKKSGVVQGKANIKRTDYRGMADWDVKPDKTYFDELFRVSKNQIVWGGNYFTDILPPSRSWLVWDKCVDERFSVDFADCELAWMNSEMGVARVFRFLWHGFNQGNMKHKEKRYHPTQKPVALYLWVLNKYAKPGYKILDTHVGSASSLIACERLGFDYVGYEIDERIYNIAKTRLSAETRQQNLFKEMQSTQIELF